MKRRLTSWLLTLAMLLSLVPAMGVTASAADGFVEVSTYEELRSEVNKGSAKVKLTADIDTTSENSGVGVTTATNLSFKGNGNVLDLNGHELKLVSNMSAYFIEILSSDLTIKDSGTNGRIEFIYGDSVVGVQRAVVIGYSVGIDRPGSLTVDGGTLSSSYHGIILIESYGSITINGGRLYAPVTDLSNADDLIHSTHSYDPDGTFQLHVNGGELDGRVVLKRDDSSATGTLKYKVTPIKITGGTFKQGLYATWKTWDSPEGEPKNAEMTMDSPTVEITGGVFERNNEEYSTYKGSIHIDLPTKLRGGTFKNGATIRFVGGKYTWDATQPQYRASIGNSAILRGNDIRTAYGWSKSDWFELQSPWIELSPKGTSVTVIPNAWGMKSVTLDGKPIEALLAHPFTGEDLQ
ncbi:MAG: pectate lyase-like adhesive domain-containing protein, partial [Dysosmobacter sp.]